MMTGIPLGNNSGEFWATVQRNVFVLYKVIKEQLGREKRRAKTPHSTENVSESLRRRDT